MTKVKLIKEEADRTIKVKDKTRGMIIKTLVEYILCKKGEVGLKNVEKRLKELG